MMQGQTYVAVAGVLLALTAAGAAQPSVGEEAAIRAAIAELPRTDLRTVDSVFFSGAYMRPFIRGQNESEPLTALARTIVPGSTKNDIRIRRIDVASSGDMAYEFSDGTVTRRMKRPDRSEEPATFENSMLRVWKKVNGQWRVAAHFSAPHGDSVGGRQ
jgi:ketosteroid isomerase-like protein